MKKQTCGKLPASPLGTDIHCNLIVIVVVVKMQ